MLFAELLKTFGNLPAIETELLMAGVPDPNATQVQVSRWRKQGKLIKLRRGVYVLASIYRKVEPSEFYLASLLNRPSYISLEKALEFHGLIPEGVPVYTSVTAKRPERLTTPLGVYDYRHVRPDLFWGYAPITSNGQTFQMALPEKALLDYFYLRGMDATPERLEGLRLQNAEKIKFRTLAAFAARFDAPGMRKAAQAIKERLLSDSLREQRL